MVSTRHHPRQFPEPATPAARSTKTTPAKTRSISSSRSRPSSPTSPTSPTANALEAVSNAVAKPRSVRRRKSTAARAGPSYTHVVDQTIIIWMMISLPLVFWDTAYLFLRPHTMPGGRLHYPIWRPYALYGTIDYVYGWPAYNDGNGFPGAQAFLNLIENLMYCAYLYVLAVKGKGVGWYKVWDKSFYSETHAVKGEGVALAIVIAFSAAVMTLSKTVLYWAHEYFSRFENIGHNSFTNLFFLWLIPNGAWIVLPSYMIYVLGKEIVGAMHLAGTGAIQKED